MNINIINALLKLKSCGATISVLSLSFLLFNNSPFCLAEKANSPFLSPASMISYFYTVQLYCLSNSNRANTIKSQLQQKGYHAYLHKITDSAGTKVYRVRIGKFPTRAEAETLAKHIEEEEKIKCWIDKVERTKDTAIASPHEKPFEVEKSSSHPYPPIIEVKTHHDAEALKKHPLNTELKLQTDKKKHKQAEKVQKQKVAKIFTYRGTNGTIHLTNSFNKIPEVCKKKISHISIFPVHYISFDTEGNTLLLDIEGQQRKIKLAGVCFSSTQMIEPARQYLEDHLKNSVLRLTYKPDQSPVISGNLFFGQGKSVSLELIRRGFASSCLDDVPQSKKNIFQQAESFAREKKEGMWSNKLLKNQKRKLP